MQAPIGDSLDSRQLYSAAPLWHTQINNIPLWTELSGKEPHEQVDIDRVIVSRSIGGVNVKQNCIKVWIRILP